MSEAITTMRITKLAGPFGAAVEHFDAAAPLADETARALVDALFEHRILLLGDQRLTEEEYARFGRLWGDPLLFFVPQHRHGAFPEIIKIRNSPATPPESRDGAMHWHSDSSYEEVPASVTMLYGIEAPETGNDTMFADMVAAYDALPESTKRTIEPLRVIHDPQGGKVNLPGEVRGSGTTEPLPVVTHPLVMRHPVTGRRALFGISGTACGIVGWDEAPAIELLLDLKRHTLQPQFRQQARVDVGTILIWDNFSVIHCATPTDYSNEDGMRRLLHRISTKGLPPVHRG
jgi:taurine dioxygenase